MITPTCAGYARYRHYHWRAALLAPILLAMGMQAGYCTDPDLGFGPEITLGQSTASVSQTGQQNNASVQQLGASNTARLDQWGQGNDISLMQLGSGNSAQLSQAGAENQISIGQYGKNNHVSGSQNGYANDIFVKQYSNSADAQITQNGNSNYTSVVTLSAGAPLVKVNQLGNGGVAKVIQY